MGVNLVDFAGNLLAGVAVTPTLRLHHVSIRGHFRDPGNLTDAERKKRGIKRFPTSLHETVDALEKDKVLTDALGSLLATSYIAVKRLEYQSFSAQDEAYEIKHHFWKF